MNKLMIAMLIMPFHVNAQVFKCDVHDKKVYQQKPCAGKGDVVAIDAPPSVQEQAAARARLETYKRNKAEQAMVAQARWDKERLIRAEEYKADAAYRNAMANRLQAAQQARQARALEDGNILQTYRRY